MEGRQKGVQLFEFARLSASVIGYHTKALTLCRPKLLVVCRTMQSFRESFRSVASWNFVYVRFADPTFPESKSKVLLKLCMKL